VEIPSAVEAAIAPVTAVWDAAEREPVSDPARAIGEVLEDGSIIVTRPLPRSG
jgi:hypothetical protein